MSSVPILLLWTLHGYSMESCRDFGDTVRIQYLLICYFKPVNIFNVRNMHLILSSITIGQLGFISRQNLATNDFV